MAESIHDEDDLGLEKMEHRVNTKRKEVPADDLIELWTSAVTRGERGIPVPATRNETWIATVTTAYGKVKITYASTAPRVWTKDVGERDLVAILVNDAVQTELDSFTEYLERRNQRTTGDARHTVQVIQRVWQDTLRKVKESL